MYVDWYHKLWITREWQLNNPDKSLNENVVYKDIKIGMFFKNLKNSYINGELKENGNSYYYGNVLTKNQRKIIEESGVLDHQKNVVFEKNYQKMFEIVKDNRSLHNYRNTWIKKIRHIYNNGFLQDDGSIYINDDLFLTKDQIERLDELNGYIDDFYTWNDSTWDRNFNILFKYLDINDSFPSGNIRYEGVDIVYWCYLQKTIYYNGIEDEHGNIVLKNKNRDRILTKRQIIKLNGIGFFERKNSKEHGKQFSEYYNLLCEYLKVYNRFPNLEDSYKGVELGKWLANQRNIFRNGIVLENGDIRYKTSVLTNKQIILLEIVGVKWYLDNNHFNNLQITEQNQYQIKRELVNRYCNNEINNL